MKLPYFIWKPTVYDMLSMYEHGVILHLNHNL